MKPRVVWLSDDSNARMGFALDTGTGTPVAHVEGTMDAIAGWGKLCNRRFLAVYKMDQDVSGPQLVLQYRQKVWRVPTDIQSIQVSSGRLRLTERMTLSDRSGAEFYFRDSDLGRLFMRVVDPARDDLDEWSDNYFLRIRDAFTNPEMRERLLDRWNSDATPPPSAGLFGG